MRLSSRWPKWRFFRNFYIAVTFVIALMWFCFCAMANDNHVIKYASSPSYDSIPITPKTWEQVDLIYYSTISSHRYTNSIQLLRPIMWLHKRHMDIIGSKVTLSMPEFGIVNVMATVKAIKPTRVNSRGFDCSKRNREYVIGRFMHYVTDVLTYTFKDSLGHISHINATPNHPFYVKNRHGFVAIGNVADTDELSGISRRGNNALHLLCANNQHTHCGKPYRNDKQPVLVYNLEIDKRSTYRVSSHAVLVHNVCGMGAFNDDGINHFSDRIATLRSRFPEGGCGYFSVDCVLHNPSTLTSLPQDAPSLTPEDIHSWLNIKQDESEMVFLFDLFGMNPPSYTDEFIIKIRNKITKSIQPGEARLVLFQNAEKGHAGILARKGESIVFIDQHLDDVPGDYYSGGWNGFQKTLKSYFSEGVYFQISQPIDSRNIIRYIK